MTVSLVGASVDALASVLEQRPAAVLIVGLVRRAGSLIGEAGIAAAATALGVDRGALAAAATLAVGDSGAVVLPTAAGARRLVVCELGDSADVEHAPFAAAVASAPAADATLVSLLALDAPESVGLIAQGHVLGAWRYRAKAGPSAPEVVIVCDDAACRSGELERARVIADAANWTRALVQAPPNRLGPREFADAIAAYAQEVAGDAVAVDVWEGDALAARGFGGTLGVGAGSARRPLVVELRVDGPGGTTALAGKGITFDSGGVNLKRSLSDLSWMKSDMAAAAAVAGAVIAAAALGGGGRIHAVLPIAENLPGGRAQRPGDVVVHPGGRTTEVTDTDCEGRLVLADALAWLALQRPERLLDVGTLTDSGAVGTAFWGCWGTSEPLAQQLLAAGRAADDPGWLLPLHPGYLALLESEVADVVNCPIDAPDTGQVAATYLRTFVGDVPWVHIDNGSSAWLERDAAPWPAGPTATPLRALVELLSPAGG